MLAAGLAATLARPSHAQSVTAPQVPPDRVLRFIPDIPPGTEMVQSAIGFARAQGYLLFDTLYGLDAAGRPRPQMVAGHEVSADSRRWRFTLREGLRFHDGSPVRAVDCIASILAWGTRRVYGQTLLAGLDTTRILDDRGFELRFRTPCPLLLDGLGGDVCFIQQASGAGDRMIGSGPFRLADAAPAGGAVYERWAGYQPRLDAPSFTSGGKRAWFERVIWQPMADPEASMRALRSGQADWWQVVPAPSQAALRASPDIHVLLNDQTGIIPVMALNHLHPPFNNEDLRRAVLLALDQDEFVSAAMASLPEQYRSGVGVFTPGSASATESGMVLLTEPRDVDKARAIIADAGAAGAPVLLLAPTEAPQIQALAQVAADLLQRIGFTVTVDSMDWATLLRRRASRVAPEQGGWNVFCTSYDGQGMTSPGPHLPLRGTGTDAWFGWPTSPRIEALRDAWFAAPDAGERHRLCESLQVAALQEVPYLPLGQWFNAQALRADLTGMISAPFPIFWNIRRG